MFVVLGPLPSEYSEEALQQWLCGGREGGAREEGSAVGTPQEQELEQLEKFIRRGQGEEGSGKQSFTF